MEIRQALTFDDVMLVPAASNILHGDTDTRTRITREIELGIPLISAAMDTVTEGALAIAMAQAGGLGVIHRNMPIETQAAEVRKVKKFEAGMVVNPVTIHPDETLLPELCRARGYATAHYGKWHLGTRPAFFPTRNGFDEWVGLPYSNDNGPLHPTVRGIPSLPLRQFRFELALSGKNKIVTFAQEEKTK